MQKSHHIVIVGGGAGGLELATKLGRKLGKKNKARITLVDSALTHVWKPLLHEVAAGSLNTDTSQVNFRAHAQLNHFEFQLGRLCDLNRAEKKVILAPIIDASGEPVVAQRSICYDSLVIAIGSSANDFGTKGAKEHCLFLDNLEQARHFHKLLLNAFLRKEYHQDNEDNKLSIAIVGAGATGVELSAELRQASTQLEHYGMHNIVADKVVIKIVEASDRILPALPERLSTSVQQELTKLDIDVAINSVVAEVNSEGLQLKDGQQVNADIKVWAAGVKAPKCLTTLDGLETNKINQLKVKQSLQTTLDDDIYSFGDCAECPQPGSDRPVPPRAQSAHQQASTLVKTLSARLKHEAPTPFVYRDYGSLISLSEHSAVGNMMGNFSSKGMFIEGRLARLFYISLYRMHQIAIHGFLRTGLFWLNDRLIKALHPKMKLH